MSQNIQPYPTKYIHTEQDTYTKQSTIIFKVSHAIVSNKSHTIAITSWTVVNNVEICQYTRQFDPNHTIDKLTIFTLILPPIEINPINKPDKTAITILAMGQVRDCFE